jgi:hypothetical protein
VRLVARQEVSLCVQERPHRQDAGCNRSDDIVRGAGVVHSRTEEVTEETVVRWRGVRLSERAKAEELSL